MRKVRVAAVIVFAGAMSLLAAQPSLATERISLSEFEQDVLEDEFQLDDTNISQLKTIQGTAITVEQKFAQIAQAAAQITGVQLNSTEQGVQVTLETTSGLASPQTLVIGNSFIANIPNAVLALSEGNRFSAVEPAAGIASVNVTSLPNNRVRVAVTGTDAPPVVEISAGSAGLVLAVTAETSNAGETEDEPIEILVTGEEEDNNYAVPDASTATRTDTPILNIPQSIQVIPRQVLEDQQVIRLEEALQNTSGVNYGGNFAGADINFNIRGFDDVPLLRDGFRQYSTFEALPETANLERIEVLRGPASILYGEIEPGGLINLVTKKPLAEPFYNVEIPVGNRGVFQPRVDISGPLTEDGELLYRLNALYLHDDGFRDYDQDFERFFIAPVVSWQIGERTNLTLQTEYTNDRGPFETGLPASGDGVVEIPYERIINEPDDFSDTDFFSIGYNLEHRFNDNWRLRNAFRYLSRDLLNVGAIPLEYDEETGIENRFFNRQNLDTKDFGLQTNVVGEFATGSIDHTLLFGIDLNRTEEREDTGFDFTPQPLDLFDPVYGLIDLDSNNLPSYADSYDRVNRLGIYLQDQVSLFDDKLILLAGIRYDTVKRKGTERPTEFNEFTQSEFEQNDSDWTPRVGIIYHPIPALSLYASYSRSFTPNLDTTASGEPLEPELGEGFEVGVKGELFDGDLLATLAYFNVTQQNVSTPDPDDPFSSVATGEQQSQGIELDVTGEILPGWNVIASYAHIDAEVSEDNDFTLIGNRLYNTPKNSVNLWTTYEIQQGDLQGLGFGIGVNFIGEREGDQANSFQLNSYFLTNAAVFYRRSNWRFALNIKNLFDIDYIAASQNSRSYGNEPGAPFTILGSVEVEF